MALILDIDGNGALDALTDGRLVLLYLLEQLNEGTIASSLGPGATRTTVAEIEGYLDSIRPLLDIDGDGEADALSDGVLNVADQFEVLEAVLQTAVREGATRTTSQEIGGYLDTLENELPVAAPDSVTIAQGANRTIAVLGNDSDPDDDALTIIGVSAATNGIVSIDDNGTPEDPSDDVSLVYTSSDFLGTDSFIYTISDGRGGTDSATVDVTVVGNESPTAADDGAIVGQEAETSIPVLGNDSDPDGDPLTITGTTGPDTNLIQFNSANGVVTISDNQLVYTSDPGFVGTDSFTYTITDALETATATVTVQVEALVEGQLTGTAENDTIVGSNSRITEGGTRENIQGGEGDDVIIGGAGADQLRGGAGADMFRYLSLADSGADPEATLEAGDDILDFDPTSDTIALLFDVAPDTPVTSADVDINLAFIESGTAFIRLSTPNMEPDFLPGQFSINLRNLDPTTTADDILGAIVFA